MPLGCVLRFNLDLGHLIRADAFDIGKSTLWVISFADFLLNCLKLPQFDFVKDRSVFVD